MRPQTLSFYQQAVQSAARRIVLGLDQALDLELLARDAALSPFHFHRVFRGMLGETPLELHRRLRLERAAWQLVNGADSVTRIAFEAGYETHEAFTRTFRLRFGSAPSEFRRLGSGDGAGCVRAPQTGLASRSGIHFARPGADPPFALNQLIGEHSMQAAIANQPVRRVAALRHTGPYNRISEAFGRLGAIAGQAGLLTPQTTMLAIYHDDPEATPETDLRSDAAVVIPEGVPVPPGLTELVIPAGRYACATHRGPYDGLGDAWARLMGEWLPESGYRFGDGVAYEVYRNTPLTAVPSDLVTELYIPLQR